MGSASNQSQLWGARARDYAELQERGSSELFEAVLKKSGIGTETKLLDIGCGPGMFCQMAAQQGVLVHGFDATEPFLEIARERTPDGDFRSGEMENLPYNDGSFDLVTGFNSFQFAASPVKALWEARRVVQHDGNVIVAVFGKREDTEAADILEAVGSLLPPPPPGTPGPFALSIDGALEELVSNAGLTPVVVEEVDCVWEYSDQKTIVRGFLSSAPSIRAMQLHGEEVVRHAVLGAIGPFKTESGGYQLKNKARYLIARVSDS